MYIAQLLTDLGCPCGHEDYFPKAISSTAYRLSRLGLTRLKWRVPPYGEAAWEAPPYLHLLPKRTIVFHQIRHPVDFVRSRQRKGLVRARFRERHATVKAGVTNKYQFWQLPLDAQIRYLVEFWIEWNALVEQNAAGMEYYRYRVDELTPEHVAWMLETVGCSTTDRTLSEVFERVQKDVNKGTGTNADVSLSSLPETLHARLQQSSTRYGFDLDL